MASLALAVLECCGEANRDHLGQLGRDRTGNPAGRAHTAPGHYLRNGCDLRAEKSSRFDNDTLLRLEQAPFR